MAVAMAKKAAKAVSSQSVPPQGSLRQVLDWLENDKGTRKCSKELYTQLIRRCGVEKSAVQGKRLHTHIVKVGMASPFLMNNIVQMYGNCGDVASASSAFDELGSKSNVHSWTILINVLIRNGRPSNALHTYRNMLQDGTRPDRYSLSLVLCGGVSNLLETRSVHAGIAGSELLDSCVVVGSSLMNAYRKHGTVNDVETVFRSMNENLMDELTWTNMISAYVEGGRPRFALELLPRMDLVGVKISLVSYGCFVAACSQLAGIRDARRVAARVVSDPNVVIDVFLQVSLVYMFAKCGSVKEAEDIFLTMNGVKNVIAWTSMITAFSRNGHNEAALRSFWRMEQDGCKPDEIAFTHVLYACGHAGLMSNAWYYFSSLQQDRGIELRRQHVGCMVDLLSRAGKLTDAEELLMKMPVHADAASWMCLLNACKIHMDVDRAERAANRVLALEPWRTGPHCALSSMYFAAGKKERGIELLKDMHDRGYKKPGGRSFIEIDGKRHEFLVGDTMHPRMNDILAEIKKLKALVCDAGYTSDTANFVHADSDDHVKEDMLSLHSEKLAMALGIISTPPKTTLRIVKNLRVCPDCHTTAKAISKLLERTIVIRDLKLFHHVQNGVCTCGDYW